MPVVTFRAVIVKPAGGASEAKFVLSHSLRSLGMTKVESESYAKGVSQWVIQADDSQPRADTRVAPTRLVWYWEFGSRILPPIPRAPPQGGKGSRPRGHRFIGCFSVPSIRNVFSVGGGIVARILQRLH